MSGATVCRHASRARRACSPTSVTRTWCNTLRTASTKRVATTSRWSGSKARTSRRGWRARGWAWTKACTVARLTASALAHAHERGVVHRDLKPWNVFVTPAGRVVLLDFGLARIRLTAEQPISATRNGVPLGTLGYMAPEQARGLDEVNASADVFSLGCVLFECLTGRRRSGATTCWPCSPRSSSTTRRASASFVPTSRGNDRPARAGHAPKGERGAFRQRRSSAGGALGAR